MDIKNTIGLVTYNRDKYLGDIIEAILTTIPEGAEVIVADDGSTDDTPNIVKRFPVKYIRGLNRGVGVNKNRILFAAQDSHFIAILEDDLKPIQKGWFEGYATAAALSDTHHFCRVQDKEVPETDTNFSEFLAKYKLTPIYGSSPRGDLTFISNLVIQEVGAFNPRFVGAGFAHGEWSRRVIKAGLVKHPNKWLDIKECRDSFVQIGDTEGGRFNEEEKVKNQIARNRQIYKELEKSGPTFIPLEFP